MISFTDKKLYLKGTCQANLSDPCTGQVIYSSNKFQTGNITTSVTMGEIRAGLGNAVAAILPSDSALNVEFTAADFSLAAKAAQLGAGLSYGAVEPACEVVTATDTTLNVSLLADTPVAQVGYPEPFVYVQTVGETGSMAETGVPYSIGADGAITGFTSATGTQYKVFYFKGSTVGQTATISSLMDPRVLHFTAQMPVFSNEACSSETQGTRVGWLYVIVPRLKLGANGGVVGDQTTADTTSLSGQAVAFDESVVSGECTDCAAGTLAYYVYIPDNGADQIVGLAVVGGFVSVSTGGTAQIPVKFVMANGELVTPSDYGNHFGYQAIEAPNGTTVSGAGVVTAGSTAGDFAVRITYTGRGDDVEYLYAVVPVSVS